MDNKFKMEKNSDNESVNESGNESTTTAATVQEKTTTAETVPPKYVKPDKELKHYTQEEFLAIPDLETKFQAFKDMFGHIQS